MRKTRSLGQAYFDALYAAKSDPWDFAASAYEDEKYSATIAALGSERAGLALEVGCSIGVLTQRLAAHCTRLVAVDFSEAALAQARSRCADLPNVDVRRAHMPHDMPESAFDLLVLSEVAYYWGSADLALMAAMIDRHLVKGGRILSVHWLGETNYPKTADQAVEELERNLGTKFLAERGDRHAEFRLDLWRRV